jgi:hypothetical protein
MTTKVSALPRAPAFPFRILPTRNANNHSAFNSQISVFKLTNVVYRYPKRSPTVSWQMTAAAASYAVRDSNGSRAIESLEWTLGSATNMLPRTTSA